MRSYTCFYICCFSVAAFLTLAGCGGETGPDLATVSGVITLDGKPVDDAEVTFNPVGGRSSMGKTDTNGKYELSYTFDKKGAMIGEHIVTITTERAAFSDESGAGKDVAARAEMLPIRYHAESELTATVNAGDNVINFELKSGGPTQNTSAKTPDA